jgi:hypothetical protein
VLCCLYSSVFSSIYETGSSPAEIQKEKITALTITCTYNMFIKMFKYEIKEIYKRMQQYKLTILDPYNLVYVKGKIHA